MSINENEKLAWELIQTLIAQGVREFCLCPGARNAPLVAVLTHFKGRIGAELSIRVYSFYEERSAAFFALGCIRRSGHPVAVLTTSGTAVGELLPATMEAYYSGLPLILVTADRPQYYRGSGAPQTAEQVGIFGVYVSASIDIGERNQKKFQYLIENKPIHFNLCFDEPLLSFDSFLDLSHLPNAEISTLEKETHRNVKDKDLERIQSFLAQVRRPLVVVGMLRPEERTSIAQLLAFWNFPTYFEGVSGLREKNQLDSFRIYSSERLLERALTAGYAVDGLIRIGGIPTCRFWRDLEAKYRKVPVLSLSSLPFSGLGRTSSLVQASLLDLGERLEAMSRHYGWTAEREAQRLITRDRELFDKVQKLLQEEPHSEPGWMATLSRLMETGAQVYLGNSLPIREWDLAADPQDKRLDVWASRGLNGIDGQISTFLGFAQSSLENWAIVGDLTALYDLPGPWILGQLKDLHASIIVINNGGGKIFQRIFPQSEFQNNHQIKFKPWADLWGLSYEEWREKPADIRSYSLHRLIEVIPDEEATDRFWKKYACLEINS